MSYVFLQNEIRDAKLKGLDIDVSNSNDIDASNADSAIADADRANPNSGAINTAGVTNINDLQYQAWQQCDTTDYKKWGGMGPLVPLLRSLFCLARA